MVTVAIGDGRRLIGQLLHHIMTDSGGMEALGPYATAADLLQAVRSRHPDVVVLAVATGLGPEAELLPALRSTSSRTYVVAVLEDRQAYRIPDLTRSGAIGHLSDSASSDELIETISRAARGEPYISRGLAWSLVGELARPGPDPALTARERAILRGIVRGDSNREIGRTLGVAEKTVKNHVTSILDKLHVRDRTEAAIRALQLGVVVPPAAEPGELVAARPGTTR